MALFVTQHYSSLSSCVPNFRILSQVLAESFLTDKNGTDKQYVAVLGYTIQLINIKLCIKYQNPNSSSR